MKKVIDFLKSNIRIIIILIIVIVFVTVYKSKDIFSHKTIYTVVNADIENLSETNLYILKNEQVIPYDSTQEITAIVDQGKRASKNEAIATYKTDSYEDYQNQITQIDKQIQTLIKDLPENYSTDISNIEDKIIKYSNEVQKETSYSKIQEYKTKLDELAYKKITILANSSPDNSAIRDLVNKREKLVRLSKSSDNTISTKMSGIVTYKLDGLEDSEDFSKILNYSAQDFENIISKYDGKSSSSFGIKVVDNFNAYFLVKTKIGEHDEYIKEGRNYNIRISDLENETISANLVKNIQDGEYNYSIFKIQNEIDNIIDYRKLSCEVVWNKITGMAVPLDAIYHDDVQNYDYVLLVYGSEKKKVAINIITKSDSIAIVENVDKNTEQSYGLDTNFQLEIYDQLLIEEK